MHVNGSVAKPPLKLGPGQVIDSEESYRIELLTHVII